MRIYLLSAAFVLIWGLASPSQADFMDGNSLNEWCTAKEGNANYFQKNASCRAYVIGVVDDFTLEMDLAKKPKCIPDNSTRGQVADVVAKYLRDNPGIRHVSAPILIRMAMVGAFGCNLNRGN